MAPTACELRQIRQMTVAKTVRERAVELASSGKCQTVNDVLFWLRVEGFTQDQVEQVFRSPLMEIIDRARARSKT